MDEGTDVDRMLARLGENNLQYREFSHIVTPPTGPWDPNEASRARASAAPPITPTGSWNTSHLPASLKGEPLLVDPEAPGGSVIGVPAPQIAVPTPAVITPPAPLDRGYVPPPVAGPVVAGPVPAPAARPSGSLDGLFTRVSGNPPPAPAASTSAPLSALFKRLS